MNKSNNEVIETCMDAAAIAAQRDQHGVADRFRAAAEAGCERAAIAVSVWVASAWRDAAANDALGAANAAARDESDAIAAGATPLSRASPLRRRTW
jgi:hypothetical protein